MTRTRIHNLSMSLDGFATGESPSREAPFGHAGERLHEWMIATRFGAPIVGRTGGTEGIDDAIARQHGPGIGAEIMGAGKFGPPGWQDDADWTGRKAAAGQDVRIGGGPTVARDFIAAGLVDHIHLVQVPIVLGRGVRLWDGLEALEADYDIEAVSTPSGVTHLTLTRS